MKKSKLSSVLTMVIVFMATLCIAKVAFAENVVVFDPNTIPTVNNSATNTPTNTANNTVAPNIVGTTNNSSAYNNTSLPKTGIESNITIFVIIGVCAISAIYAYRKVNDYSKIK